MSRLTPTILRRGNEGRRIVSWIEAEFCALAIAAEPLLMKSQNRSVPRSLTQNSAEAWLTVPRDLNCGENAPPIGHDEQASHGSAATRSQAEQFRGKSDTAKSAGYILPHGRVLSCGKMSPRFVFGHSFRINPGPTLDTRLSEMSGAGITAERVIRHQRPNELICVNQLPNRFRMLTWRNTGINI
jgi:hypothetical protein